jgi:hypothetical protein
MSDKCSIFFCFLAYTLVRHISDISTRINDVSNRWIDKDQILCLINPSSTGKNAEIVRPDVMTRVRTRDLSQLCEFNFSGLLLHLKAKKKNNQILSYFVLKHFYNAIT